MVAALVAWELNSSDTASSRPVSNRPCVRFTVFVSLIFPLVISDIGKELSWWILGDIIGEYFVKHKLNIEETYLSAATTAKRGGAGSPSTFFC